MLYIKAILHSWLIKFICLFFGAPEDHKVIYSRGISLDKNKATNNSAPVKTIQPPIKYATRSNYVRNPYYQRKLLREGKTISTIFETENKNSHPKPNLAWREIIPLRNRLTRQEFVEGIWDGASKYYCRRMRTYLLATNVFDLTDEEFDLLSRIATCGCIFFKISAEFIERTNYTLLTYNLKEHSLTPLQQKLINLAAQRVPNPNPKEHYVNETLNSKSPYTFNSVQHNSSALNQAKNKSKYSFNDFSEDISDNVEAEDKVEFSHKAQAEYESEFVSSEKLYNEFADSSINLERDVANDDLDDNLDPTDPNFNPDVVFTHTYYPDIDKNESDELKAEFKDEFEDEENEDVLTKTEEAYEGAESEFLDDSNNKLMPKKADDHETDEASECDTPAENTESTLPTLLVKSKALSRPQDQPNLQNKSCSISRYWSISPDEALTLAKQNSPFQDDAPSIVHIPTPLAHQAQNLICNLNLCQTNETESYLSKLYADHYVNTETLLQEGLSLKFEHNYLQAFPYFLAAAEIGNMVAQFEVASCFEFNIKEANHFLNALNWYFKSAQQGYAKAQARLGWLYRIGKAGPRAPNIAVTWFFRAAAQGEPSAQYGLGLSYKQGLGIEQDYSKAHSWFNLASMQNFTHAQYEMGLLYRFGLGVPKDDKLYFRWMLKAALQQDRAAQYEIGLAYLYGLGIKPDYDQAIKWIKDSANQNYIKAQNMLGSMYQNGLGVKHDFAEAFKWYCIAANNGYSPAKISLGWFYEHGLGVQSIDYNKAIYLYEQAAKVGNSSGFNCLGWMHQQGLGVPKNYTNAMHLYKQAISKGNTSAMINLAWMYQQGIGVETNYKIAFDLYYKAALLNNAKAQTSLGWFYQHGLAVCADYKIAVKWYTKAANNNNPQAQFLLAQCYEQGIGVQVDLAKAKNWYLIASDNGYTQAQESLKRFKYAYSYESN